MKTALIQKTPRNVITKALLAVALSLTGCQTAAQRTLTRATTESTKGMAEANACAATVRSKPEHAEIVRKLPERQPDLEQLANNSKMTASERNEYLNLDKELSACRAISLQTAANYSPGMYSAMMDGQNKFARTRLKLVQGQVTWGQYYQEISEDQLEYRKLIQSADRQFKGDLELQHNQEIQQRARIAADIQENAQRQQMINAINRPVNTSCNRFGDQVNCTSY